MEKANPIREAYTRLIPEIVGRSTIVNPIEANATPVAMLLMFNAIASKNVTDLVSPVASLMNTGGLELDKKPFVINSRNDVFITFRQKPNALMYVGTHRGLMRFDCVWYIVFLDVPRSLCPRQ